VKAGPAIAATVLIIAGVTPVLLAATGKLTVVADTCAALATSLGTSLRSFGAQPPSADDSAPPSDAGASTPSVHRQAGPLSSAQLGAPLIHGTFVSACGAPDSMRVVLNVTVKMGRVTDVHATTTPPNPVVESCIERAARDLQWDVSPKTGHVTVTY
jgi:hypothetical protein